MEHSTAMEHSTDFDRIDVEHLRKVGSLKWSLFPGTLGAFVAEMDFGTAPEVRDALHRAVDLGQFGYLPTALAAAMSQAAADWHRDAYGWDISADQIHPVADVLQALEIAIEHFTRPGSPVIIPTPSYMPFLEVVPALGRQAIEVPLAEVDGRYCWDLDALAAAFRAGAELLILCNPYNPVGRVFDRQELEAVAAVVAEHNGRVFADEIHAPLVYPGASHLPYASLSSGTAGHTLTATSASKAWNIPGVKCAQLIVSNDADAAGWERLGMRYAFSASTLGVIAHTAAYTSGRAWLDQVISYLDGNRRALGELVATELPAVRYVEPEGTYVGWLDCRELAIQGSAADFFREHAGVSLTDGLSCGAAGAGFVRLTFATPRPILETALTQMGAAVREHGTR